MSEPRTAAVLTSTWGDDGSPTGPGEGASALAAYRDQLFAPAVEAHGGRITGGGPGVLTATFDRAEAAVTCAAEIRRRTDARYAGEAEGRPPPVRWGVALAGDASGAPSGGQGEVTVSAAVAAAVDPALLSRSVGRGGDGARAAWDATVFGPPRDAAAGPAGAPVHRPDRATSGDGLRAGGLLNGTYEIEERLASGGMGEVFRGREVHSGGAVAVKVIRLDMVDHPSALSLFQKEALVLRDIYHDAIVRYYSFSFDPGLGRHYLVMEFVDGPPLSRVVEAGPLPVETVALLCRRVASGLQVAHERGIVHRDLSPDNVILPGGDAGRAKIIDFGIARAAAIGGGTIIDGGFAGKNSYVSPEHLGLAGGEVTAKSDIYSLGIVLAEACLGHPLDMAGTQVEVIDKRRRVPDLSGVDPRLRGLVARMLDPDPERRPASMGAVAAAAVLPPPPGPGPAGVGRPAPPRPARPVERWILGGALALALAGGIGVFAYTSLSGGGPSEPARPPSPPLLAPPDEPATASGEARPPPAPPVPPVQPPVAVQPPPAVEQRRPTGPPPEQQANSGGTATPASPPMAPPPPSPPTAPPPPSVSMADYIASYPGGDCFFLRPVRLTPTSVALDAFATSKDAFAKLDRAFQDRFGVSPDIAGNRVWSRQCPAVEFLKRTAAQAAAPTLFVRSARIRKGQNLVGEIRGLAGRSVRLLLVGEDGTVRDVTGALKPDGDALVFELAPPPDATPGAPEILVAVASPRPLSAPGDGASSDAGRAFGDLLGTAIRQNAPLAADARLLIVGG